MREFSKISPAIWRSKRFRNLETDDARLVMLYLLTNEHLNSAGCYRLPPAYAGDDLGWPSERFSSALNLVVAAGLASFDTETSEVLLSNWFKHNPPMNKNHLTGVLNALEKLESEYLREAGLAALNDFQNTSSGSAPSKPDNVLNYGEHLTSTSLMNGRQLNA